MNRPFLIAAVVIALGVAAWWGCHRWWFVRTLEETETRTGHPLELDRAHYVKTSTGDVLRIFTGETIRTTKEILEHSATVSVRGRFVTPTQLDVLKFHEHSAWFRNVSSYLGILLLSGMWVVNR